MVDAEAQDYLLDEGRLQQFRDGLHGRSRRTVPLDLVWRAFFAAYKDVPNGPERRVWLLSALEWLAQHGDVQLPVKHGKLWDRTNEIALPTTIKLVAAPGNRDKKPSWRRFPWHPSLQWVLTVRTLSRNQVAFLMRVNQGLVEGWFAEPECFKYRSLQLTGHEKRLERFLKGALFGPGCLTLEMLGCERDALPLVSEQVSTRPTMVIFENAAPYMLARSIAVTLSSIGIGRLAYGAGKQVLKAATYLSMIEPSITEVLYVGDLDVEGLSIAADLQQLSKHVTVQPAHDFHRAMLKSAADLEAPDGWPVQDGQSSEISERVFSILAADTRSKVRGLVAAGRRIPEEVLSRDAMSCLLSNSG